jgi:MFS family permease
MPSIGIASTPSDRQLRWLVIAMVLPLMMLTIDAFGLTVALPSIGRDLNANTATLAWVLNAFLLAFAAPQLGAAFGLAVCTALFKAVENARLVDLLSEAGVTLTASDQAEIRSLLSGSSAAQERLQALAPAAAGQLERIVDSAFIAGFHAAMALCLAVAIVGLAAALLMPGRPAKAAKG